MTDDPPRRSRHSSNVRTAVEPSVEPTVQRPASLGAEVKDALQRLRGDRPEVDPPAPSAEPIGQVVRRLKLAFYVGGILAVLVILAGGAIGVYTLQVGADVNTFTSAEAVAANRERAASEVLGTPGQDCTPTRPESVTFECLNRDRVVLGLSPVVPLAGLAPSQLGAVLGEERAELRRVRAERGEGARDGVSTPEQGRFRSTG